MQTLPITVACLKAIQTRAYNNARLIKLADKIRQYDLLATIDGEKIRVQYDNETTTKVFSVRKFSELIGQIPCQYCHSKPSDGIAKPSKVFLCNSCYCSEHDGNCGQENCDHCNSPEKFEEIHGFAPQGNDMTLFSLGF